MKYQEADIIIFWTRLYKWKWSLLKRPGKIIQEYLWAPLVRLVSGPIHVSMVAVGGDRTSQILMWDVPRRDNPHQPPWYWAHEIAVYRAVNWDDEAIRCMSREWTRANEKRIRYGYVRNVAHFLDWAIGLFGLFEVFLFRRIFKGGPRWGRECGNHVANRVWVCTGKDFGVHQDAADPGDIDRFCLGSGKYRTILPRTSGWREW